MVRTPYVFFLAFYGDILIETVLPTSKQKYLCSSVFMAGARSERAAYLLRIHRVGRLNVEHIVLAEPIHGSCIHRSILFS